MPTRIVVFFWLTIADFALDQIWSLNHHSSRVTTNIALFAIALGLIKVITALLIIRRRIGWLRWFVASWYLVELVDYSWTTSTARLFFLYLPEVALHTAALYCLFSHDARVWFADRPREIGPLYRISAVVCGTILGVTFAIGMLTTAVAIFHKPLTRALEDRVAALTPSDPAAIFAGRIFNDACLTNIGHPDQVRSYAAENRFSPITDPASLRLLAGENPTGEFWQASIAEGDFALSVKRETQKCIVWAKNANARDAELVFKSRLREFVGHDAQLTQTGDIKGPTPHGNEHLLKYRSFDPNKHLAVVYFMSAAEQAGESYQVLFEAAGENVPQ
jgi:hypothetical protein